MIFCHRLVYVLSARAYTVTQRTPRQIEDNPGMLNASLGEMCSRHSLVEKRTAFEFLEHLDLGFDTDKGYEIGNKWFQWSCSLADSLVVITIVMTGSAPRHHRMVPFRLHARRSYCLLFTQNRTQGRSTRLIKTGSCGVAGLRLSTYGPAIPDIFHVILCFSAISNLNELRSTAMTTSANRLGQKAWQRSSNENTHSFPIEKI
jgi:hypothetical protein